MFIFKAVMETKADERMRDKWTGNEVWANEKYTNLEDKGCGKLGSTFIVTMEI